MMGAHPVTALPASACKRSNCPVCRFNRPVLDRALGEFLHDAYTPEEYALLRLAASSAMVV